jgi:hypothetical protein
MLNTPQVDKAIRLVEDNQHQVAKWAWHCHASHGRGAVGVYFPRIPSDLILQMSYTALQHVRMKLADAADDRRLLEPMVETYDPDREAVVIAFVNEQNPIAMMVTLAPPFRVGVAGELISGVQPWRVQPASDEEIERRIKERESRRKGH